MNTRSAICAESSEEDVARLREVAKRGITAADRGEFVEPEEVWANVEKILRS
jgi:predicted transcriptional regulator